VSKRQNQLHVRRTKRRKTTQVLVEASEDACFGGALRVAGEGVAFTVRLGIAWMAHELDG